MKVVGIIPTAGRITAPKVAAMISSVCDQIFIIAKDCHLPASPLYQVLDQGSIGLAATREWGADIASNFGYDAALIVDDDIAIKEEAVQKMVVTAEEFPALGAVTTSSRVEQNWNKELHSNFDWTMVHHLSSVTLLKVKTIKLMKESYRSVYVPGINDMDDILGGLRMWYIGIPIGRLHGNMSWSHNETLAMKRKIAGENLGGITQEDRDKYRPLAVKHINDHFVGNIVKSSTATYKDGHYKMLTRLNYDEMCRRSIERNGTIGYKDNKGKGREL